MFVEVELESIVIGIIIFDQGRFQLRTKLSEGVNFREQWHDKYVIISAEFARSGKHEK
jgi:hypothetical protein